MSSAVINEAVEALQSNDVVFGPSEDGGYYLVGMKKVYKEIFELEKWSHSNVLAQSLKKVESLGLTYALIKELNDLDTIEDLEGFPDLKAML